MKRLRKMLFGEKMPDKDDPKYKAKYERDVEAGRKFARATRLDRGAAGVQRFAERHTAVFFGTIFLLAAFCFAFSIRRMTLACRYRDQTKAGTAIQDSLLAGEKEDISSYQTENEEP